MRKPRTQLSGEIRPQTPHRGVRLFAIFGFGLALRSEEHTSELQSRQYLVCRLLLYKSTVISLFYSLSLHGALPILFHPAALLAFSYYCPLRRRWLPWLNGPSHEKTTYSVVRRDSSTNAAPRSASLRHFRLRTGFGHVCRG